VVSLQARTVTRRSVALAGVGRRFRTPIRYTGELFWGLAYLETAILWQQLAVARAEREFELSNSHVTHVRNDSDLGAR
jgi:hypothetical protein